MPKVDAVPACRYLFVPAIKSSGCCGRIAADAAVQGTRLAQNKNHSAADSLLFLQGGGEMGDCMRAYDWSATPLGSPEHWPVPLKTLAGVMLVSTQPMFMAWGSEQTWLYNSAFIPILGAKHPRALGRPAMEVWEEARADLEPLFARVFAGEPIHMEDLGLQLDRHGKLEEAHFSFSYNPARDAAGAVVGLFGVCVEITQQVLANRALAAQREKFAALFEQAPTFMAMLRGPEHRIELANPRYLELVGNRPVVGLTVAEALPDAVAQGYLEILDTVFHTGRAFTAVGLKYAAQADPSGPVNERFLDFVYQPITGNDGAVAGIFVQGVDVTERRKAEDALQNANETLERRVAERTDALRTVQTFYTHSAECHAVLTQREDGAFQYDEINPATLRLYGMTRDQVIGRTTDQIFDAERATALNAHLLASLNQDTPYRYVRTIGGSTVEAISTSIPPEPGGRPRLAVTARDITERQNLEEQLRQAQKMEAIGQLTGGIAHDFNNLLAAFSGSLELIGKRIAQGRFNDVDRFLGAAQEASRRAAALTQRLLAFSRRQTLDPRALDVNILIRGMEDLIRRSVGPNISVEVVGAGGLWLTKADAPQLENSLLNLCINGRDAMAPHGGRLTIETANKWLDDRAAKERELPPGQYISLSVTDTGAGMTPQVMARVFDPFFTTKPLGEGTGLGLSMVHGFVRQSGGQVRIYSELGKGTTVCLYLPRHTGKAEPAVYPTTTVGAAGAGETVLVIDDEPTIRMVIVGALADSGYSTLEAGDGASALRILQSDSRIDLLITDVGLPGGLNGRQIADAARIKRPDLKVLFITGFAENAVVGNGHLAPGMEVITKPFAMTDMASKVRDLIERV
jgi:PAS domain S-box-containing protein